MTFILFPITRLADVGDVWQVELLELGLYFADALLLEEALQARIVSQLAEQV